MTKPLLNKTIQIRVSEEDKQLLSDIRDKDRKFNVSSYFRSCLQERYAELSKNDVVNSASQEVEFKIEKPTPAPESKSSDNS